MDWGVQAWTGRICAPFGCAYVIEIIGVYSCALSTPA